MVRAFLIVLAVISLVIAAGAWWVFYAWLPASCSEGVVCERAACLRGDGLCDMWQWDCDNGHDTPEAREKACPAAIPYQQLSLASLGDRLQVTTKCFGRSHGVRSDYLCGFEAAVERDVLISMEDIQYCPSRSRDVGYEIAFRDAEGRKLEIYSPILVTYAPDRRIHYVVRSPEGKYVSPCFGEGRAEISRIINETLDAN
jgi:hypothetical protein